METKSIELHQKNMYCIRCFNNVMKVLSKIEDVKEIDINMANKIIKIKYEDEALGKKKIQALINQAITTGSFS